MADVAKLMGVATGTVYLYVESKEALFDLVIRSQAGLEYLEPLKLPIKTPAPGSTLKFIKSQFDLPGQWPALDAALDRPRAENPGAELRSILGELYQTMTRYRVGLTMLRRSALEYPGLYEVFINGQRKRLHKDLVLYLESRIAAGQFMAQKKVSNTAVMLLQTLSWAAVQRHSDPEYRQIDNDEMAECTLDTLVRGMLA